jgi:hypothetical protein
MSVDWTNSDGLEVRFTGPEANQSGAESVGGAIKNLVVDFNFAEAITAAAWSHESYIPAGSYILSATLIVTSAMTGSSGTLTIGLAQKDGTVIDADGIDAAVAQATLIASAVVKCDGALAGGTAAIGAADGYVYTSLGGTVSGGRGRLVIEYIEV